MKVVDSTPSLGRVSTCPRVGSSLQLGANAHIDTGKYESVLYLLIIDYTMHVVLLTENFSSGGGGGESGEAE